MASPDEHRTPRTIAQPGLGAADSALVFVFAIAAFLTVGVLGGGGLWSLAAAELLGLAGVPLAIARIRAVPLASFGLTWPPWRAVVGAALVGATIWFIDLRIAELFRAADPDATRHLEAMVRATPLAAIIVLSLTPAIGEELACRGVLALGVERRLGQVGAVLVSAAAFAVLHPSVSRMPAMFVLGAVLATLTVRTRSILPAMLAHALNNAIALVLADGHLSDLVRALAAHPDLALVACLALCGGGIALAWRPRT